MKQSTDDLAKFKPSQTLTLNIALGSGSTAGAGKREPGPTLHQTHIVEGGLSLVKPAVTSKGCSPREQQERVPPSVKIAKFSQRQSKGNESRKRQITLSAQGGGAFPFPEVAETV